MSGTTYSRTGGTGLLPRTYHRLRDQHPELPFEDLQKIVDRLSGDAEAQARWVEQVEQMAYLRFSRGISDRAADDPASIGAIVSAPGQPSERTDADNLVLSQPEMLENEARRLLELQGGLSPDRLDEALKTFSGTIEVRQMPAGTVLYRVVGLIASPDGIKAGLVVNRPLGEYWMREPPTRFTTVAQWRSSMAVRTDWNGDHGYVKITLSRPCWVAEGLSRAQTAHPNPHLLHPGGGVQIFLPGLSNEMLVEPILGRPLHEIIKPTGWEE